MMKDDLEKFISDNAEQLDNATPNPDVLNRILGQMQVEQKPKGIMIPFRVLQWAAAGLVLVGLGITFLLNRNTTKVKNTVAVVNINNVAKTAVDSTTQSQPVAAITKPTIAKGKTVDSIDEELALRKQAFLVKLSEQKNVQRKQVLFASLKNMDSPAGRITATGQINQLKNAGKDVVDVLVQTLNHDPSANVRLAALDGLARFYQDGYVRKKLVTSLNKQQDPVVQIALIDLLTRMKESAVLTELDKLVGDETTETAVKDCAYSGILKLRRS